MIHCTPSVPSATSGPRRSIIVMPTLGPELKGGGRPFLAGSRGISARGATGVPPTPPEASASIFLAELHASAATGVPLRAGSAFQALKSSANASSAALPSADSSMPFSRMHRTKTALVERT